MAISINTINSIIREINGFENVDRKRVSHGQYEIYRDKILAHVRAYLEGFYSKDTVKEMPIVSTINLARRIVNEEAAIYSCPPKRKFIGVTPEQEILLEKVYKDMKADQMLLKSNQFFKLQDQNILQVSIVDKKLKLKVLTCHQLDVIPSAIDAEEAAAYIVSGFDYGMHESQTTEGDGEDQAIADYDDYKASTKRLAWFTKNQNFITNDSGMILSTDTENPLGIMPFVDISSQKDGQFWVQNGSALTDFTIQFNAAMSDQGHIVRMQGFGQAWYKGSENNLPQNLQIGPNFVLRLPVDPNNPVDTSFGFAQPGADIAGAIQFAESLLSAFMTSRGVNPKLVNTKGDTQVYASGFERLLAMLEAFKPSKNDFEVYKDAEQKLFKIVARYLNTYGGSTLLPNYSAGQINEDAYVELYYHEPQMIQTEREEFDLVRDQVETGFMSEIEAIMRLRKVDKNAAMEIRKTILSEEKMLELKKNANEQQGNAEENQ